jgi:hypothetical protein
MDEVEVRKVEKGNEDEKKGRMGRDQKDCRGIGK